jgi:hypothetical protein
MPLRLAVFPQISSMLDPVARDDTRHCADHRARTHRQSHLRTTTMIGPMIGTPRTEQSGRMFTERQKRPPYIQ